MKNKYPRVRLDTISKVDISSVDKKTVPGERAVRLCNYTNVYNNWAISSFNYDELMEASVNAKEYSLFNIKKGFVAITKDSETRDDIGKSCYLSETMDDVVLGYHCALIKPNEEQLNGKFLNAFLHSKSGLKHFENNASGSGQRFTLTSESIGSVKVPLPPIDDQLKIGNFFSSIDRMIETNKKLIKLCKETIETNYQYWFVQFNFPKNNKPYALNGGKLVFDEELKREIPLGWSSATLYENDLTEIIKPGVSRFDVKNYIPTGNVDGSEFVEGGDVTFENRESRANMQPIKNSVWFAKMKNSIKHLSISCYDDWFINRYILSTGFLGLKCKNNSFAYIHSFINSYWFEKVKDYRSHGATQEAVNNEDLDTIKLLIPPQDVLEAFNNLFEPYIALMNKARNENIKLETFRNKMIPLLTYGQVKVRKEL